MGVRLVQTYNCILGVGAKMFVIAGPVIVYGTVASVAYGIIYWIMQMIQKKLDQIGQAFLFFISNNAVIILALTTSTDPTSVNIPSGSLKTTMPTIMLVIGSNVLKIDTLSPPIKNALF